MRAGDREFLASSLGRASQEPLSWSNRAVRLDQDNMLRSQGTVASVGKYNVEGESSF